METGCYTFGVLFFIIYLSLSSLLFRRPARVSRLLLVGPSRNRKHKQYANRPATLLRIIFFLYYLPFRPRLIASNTRAQTDAMRARHVLIVSCSQCRRAKEDWGGKNCAPCSGGGSRASDRSRTRFVFRNKKQNNDNNNYNSRTPRSCGIDANRKSRACRPPRCIFNCTSASGRPHVLTMDAHNCERRVRRVHDDNARTRFF